ncbi:DNA internalization-related competence protein ComEC/Rec2 [Roseateles noduli]|uniref:DNA internalization-related competence protein ComEC/Rec2 n=1 Tax=Roseateles noduli TaxID=2052484 RepID=UPI003D65DD11
MGLVHVLPELPGPAVWRAWTAIAVMLTFTMVLPLARPGRRRRPALADGIASIVSVPPVPAAAHRRRCPSRWTTHWLAWSLLAAIAGAGLTAARAGARMAEVPDVDREGQVMTLTGRVDSLPQRTDGIGGVEGWRFILAVEPSAVSAGTPPRVLLSCYQMPFRPRAGERWRLDVKLRRPHGLMNPHGFDQALWMLDQDLPAAGSCRSKGQERLATSGFSVDALRQSMRDAIDRQLSERRDRRGAGVLAALSLGDQGAVNAADWGLYRDAGVSHLLSVSGLHVTMFAWLAGAVAGWAWRRSTRLCLCLPAPRAAMWIGVVAAGLYALFSGWGVPSQRTVGLLAILALLRQAGARWPWPMSLCAAAAGVCAADPWALTQAGFWLSFVAVALLMAADHRADPGWRGALRNAWHTQWVVTLGLAPLTLLLFQQLSIVGVVANAFAIPLVSYVITPLAMLGVLCPPLWTLGAWCVALMNAMLEALRVLPLAVWHLPWPTAWAQALGLVGGAVLAMPWPWRLRLGGLALCVPMFWPVIERPAPGHLDLWLPDVGQGGATILRTQGHTMVFDAGPSWGPGSDAGQRVLLPLLHGLGERRLDLLMVSHADQDHVGGAASLLAGMPVERRLGAVPGGEGCRRGQRWTWDGVRFEVLWPIADSEPGEPGEAGGAGQRRKETRRNAGSCVLRVEAAGRRVLLTGDIEAPQEARLVRDEGGDGLRSEVLVVPHHGSRTSSTVAFVGAVAPRVAAVQSGYLNRFGHPKPDVVARYLAADALLLNTVDCGAWRWRSDRWSPPIDDCERAARRRYWLRLPPGVRQDPPTLPWLPDLAASLPEPDSADAVPPGVPP